MTASNIILSWDGKSIVRVSVPKSYAGKMNGICGDCNGNKFDDFKTKAGTNIYKKGNRDMLVGISYQVLDDEGTENEKYAICNVDPR